MSIYAWINRPTVKPTDPCPLCQRDFGEDELILLESGRVLSHKKDPVFSGFYADWRMPPKKQPRHTIVKMFHFDCYYQMADQAGLSNWKHTPDQWECHICDHDFSMTPWAFRISVGGAGAHGEFEVDDQIPKRAILCSACITSIFGGGDADEGDALVYKGVL